MSVCAFAADVAGVTNFHEINDHVSRGAQPSPEGFQNLAKMGVKTVIDLRESGSRAVAEKKVVEGAGMHYVNIPLRGLGAPADDVVVKLLAMFENRSSGPVFIHCRRGADRTGTICACYRITHDHWDNQKALAEAKSFGMSWMERAMQHYVLAYHAAAPAMAGAVPAVATATPQ